MDFHDGPPNSRQKLRSHYYNRSLSAKNGKLAIGKMEMGQVLNRIRSGFLKVAMASIVVDAIVAS